MADANALIGSWKMDSWTRTSVETGETTDALGPAPIGYIAYHADGRMMATVFRRDRPAPGNEDWSKEQKSQMLDDMLAYVASYTLEEDRVVHHVDGAWNPNWAGDVARPFKLRGGPPCDQRCSRHRPKDRRESGLPNGIHQGLDPS